MRILLYHDETIDLNIRGIASGLQAATEWSVAQGKSQFLTPTQPIRYPDSYQDLSEDLLKESSSANLAICFTRVPYENNFFFEYSGNLAVVSFYAWEQLTSLPLENGVVYFILSLVRSSLPLPDSHDETSGCIHDFLWDKRGVDTGMRAGHFCSKCKAALAARGLGAAQEDIFERMDHVLSELASSSRADQNVVELWRSQRPGAPGGSTFDVFLCHKSEDKDEVKEVARMLTSRGVSVWLDEQQLRPGLAWQVALEKQINSIRTAAVFVGDSGVGPWQNLEMRALLSEFVSRQCPVIPVILQSASGVPELPIFLRQLTWVDFRANAESAMKRLIWGITGRRD